jgi:glycosyltransferase involved in cell wall biosynthesis
MTASFPRTRVLQVMGAASRGGAELFFERLVIALHRRSLPQKVVVRTHPARTERLRRAGLDVEELAFGGPLDVWTGPQLRRLAAAYKPHIVLTWQNRATVKMPRGDFVHIARLGGYYKIKNYRHCDCLIGITPDMVRWLIEQHGWPRDRAVCIPNFADTTRMAPCERSSLATPGGKKLVLAMGRLHENKGFDVLLRALAKLPDVYLWLAGAGPEEARLRALADALDLRPRVRFLGWREDIAALLAAADVFVCPSRHEPLGSVTLEAWANTVPVVATASQGPRYLIESGSNGILVGIDRADDLAEAIGKVLADGALARRLAEAGRRTYETQFSEEQIVGEYLRLFERFAGVGDRARHAGFTVPAAAEFLAPAGP